jgi:hypothetical protein
LLTLDIRHPVVGGVASKSLIIVMVSQGILLSHGLATIYRLLRGSQWGVSC